MNRAPILVAVARITLVGAAVACAAARAPATAQQDRQQRFERAVIDADLAGDAEGLRRLAVGDPDRALRLVRNLLSSASAAGADPRLLAGAERIARALHDVPVGSTASAEVERVAALDAAARAGRARCAGLIGACLEGGARGELAAAAAHAREAAELAASLGENWLEGRARRLLGELLRRLERHAEARDELQRAADLLDAAGGVLELLPCRHELGALQALLGDYAEAEADLDRALDLARSQDETERAARIEEERGMLESSRGRYAEAIRRLRAACATWRECSAEREEGRALVALGGTYSELGLSADAEDALSRAIRIFEAADSSAERGRAVTMLGLARLDAGRAADALGLLDLGLDLARQSGDRPGVGNCQRQRGRALAALEELADAEAAYREALDTSEAVGDRFGQVLDLCGLADVLAARGLDAAAERAYRRAFELGCELRSAEATWRARVGLGRLAERSGSAGSADLALEHYLAAIAEVESLRSLLAAPALRRQYLGDKLELYWRAARLALRGGDVAGAFRLAEAAKARTLIELAAVRPPDASPFGAPAGSPLAKLGEVESRLQALERSAARVPAGDSALRAELGRRVAAARAEHQQARLDVELADPRDAALAGLSAAPSPEQLGAALPVGASLVEYLVGPDSTLAFVVRRRAAGAGVAAGVAAGIEAVELGAGSSELALLVDRVLRPIDHLLEGRVDLPNLRFDAKAAQALWAALLAPIETRLAESNALIVVPDGPLRRLPFALLVTRREPRPVRPGVLFAQYHGCRFLVEDRAVTYLPSAALLVHQPAPGGGPIGRPTGGPALVLADPAPAPAGGSALPGSRREAEAVARSWGPDVATVLVGADASEARFKLAAPAARSIHVAAHATLDEDRPAYSRVALAPGGGEDGWLCAYEVERLALVADRVVLSSCRSAGTAGRGEGLLGLSRAFLRAGAGSVTATLWAVDDRATARLVELWHAGLRGGAEPGAALRRAQVQMLDEGRARSLPEVHPFFWAGFVHFGPR